jgi:hypothetical protein
MGSIARFLIALERLARKSGLKIEDAYKFAKQEFGEVTPLLKKQIQNIFAKIKKPVVGKPGKKEGAVIPMVKEGTKKAEGIETLDTGLPTQFTEKEIDAAIDNASPGFSGDMKYDAELVADDLADKRFDKEFYDLDQKQQMDLYDQAYQGLSKQRFKQKTTPKDPQTKTDDKGLTDSPLDDLKKIIEDSGGTAKTQDEVLRDEMLKDPQTKKLDELMNFFRNEIEKADAPKLDSKENIMGAIDKLKNPRRPGGPLDPAIGVTRTLARRVLEKRGIEIGKKDPINVFNDTFGEAIVDLKNLGEEMIEADQTGRQLKPMDDLLEIEGFFDMEIPKNPNKGIPTEEMIEQLEKDLEQKEMLEDFDVTFRKPNATGGRVQAASGGLADILKV